MLRTSEKIGILNRTSRALANMAEDELSVLVMEELGLIPEFVKLLTKTPDIDCQQSVLRALRMVCTTSERKQAVLDLDAMKTIMEMLKSDTPALVNCCIRTVAELTKGCSREIAQQVQDYGGVKYIVELANNDSSQVRHPALLSLANLAYHAHVRVCIGSEGGIHALTQQLMREEPGHVTVKAIEGLCFCCREAINRVRVRESGALELLLKIFSSGECLSLEKKIVTAFTCFYNSERDLEILLNGDLVAALINHLKRIISHIPSRNECEDHDDVFSDHQNFTADFSSDSQLRVPTVKDAFFDSSAGETSLMDESFLKKLEETAREVTDSKVTGRLSKFKRRMKLKPSPIPTTPPAGVCTIGQSVFSFASRQTNTTTLVSVCTSCRSISSLASSSSHSANLSMSSCPRVLSSYQVSTPTINTCDLGEPSGLGAKDPAVECVRSQSQTLDSTIPRTSASQSDQSVVTPVNCQTQAMMNESLVSPLSPKAQAGLHHHRGPGHSALVMLSRISMMTDPSSLLINKPCIQACLDYLRLVNNPICSSKCVRLLNRLAFNSLCLKALIVNGAVVAFHHQLCCMCSESQDIAAAATVDTNAPHSLEEQRLQTPCSSTIPADSTFEQDDKIRASEMYHPSTQSYCQETGNHLLEIFSNQVQTPFGKGVLENLLLKGSKEEREECVLVLPLLCRYIVVLYIELMLAQ